VAGYVLSDILPRYRRAFPQVELNVIEDNGDYLQHLLIGGELDVAVLLTSSVRDRLALHVETLLVSPYRLWLPLGHPLAQQEAITLEELAGQPLIQLMVDEIEESTRRLMAAMPVKPDIAFRTRSVEAVRSLVATGRASRSCPAWSIGPGRWKATGSRSATSRATCRRCRWALPGARGRRWRRRPTTSSARPRLRLPAGRCSRPDLSEYPISRIQFLHLRFLPTRIPCPQDRKTGASRHARRTKREFANEDHETDGHDGPCLADRADPGPGPDHRDWRPRGAGEHRRLARLYRARRDRAEGFDWVTKFEAASGCKVNVKTANTSDEMVALMNEGGFDLVTASGDASLRLVAGNRVQPINLST
jgi:hypothetical protein